jgi:glycosyltransferase involved in cell wall biosynthesis
MNIKIAIIENNIIAVNSIREKLIRAFMEKGYEVIILTSGTFQQMQAAKEKGFNVIDVGSSTQNPADILRYLFRIYKAIKRSRVNACLTFTIRPAIWGNIITRVLKIPTITNITGIGPLFEKDNIAYRGARVLYRFALKKTIKIFFQNLDDMAIFVEKRFVNPAVAERIPGSGVDHDQYQPRKRKNNAGKFNFIFISRLVKDKGIREYVNSAKMLKKELPDVAFNVLGPIWQQNLKNNTVTEAEINGWVEEGLINYLGETRDVREFIAETDCVVLPSYREGLSNVLLEASSMEKPCITGNVTGCKEIVEDGVTGYLCRVQDAYDLAVKMKMMYNLPEEKRAEMGKNARQKVIMEFDKKIVIDAYLKAVAQVTDQ